MSSHVIKGYKGRRKGAEYMTIKEISEKYRITVDMLRPAICVAIRRAVFVVQKKRYTYNIS